jgi:predicted nucleic acid-binding protein
MDVRTKSYADTSAFIAFLDRSDSYHHLFLRLFSEPKRLVTSALVIAEGHGWFLRRYDIRRATQFLAFIDVLPNLTIIGFDSKELGAASRVVKKYADQPLTLADAHGIAIMREQKVSLCWSTDRHLAIGGATLITDRQ